MTAGAFLTCGPMVEAFGLHEMKNKAEAVRRVWPNAIPKGKEEINFYHAAYLIYVFASTDKIRDIHDRVIAQRVWSCAHSHNDHIQANAMSFIGDLIADKGTHSRFGRISQLEISKKTGIVKVVLGSDLRMSFIPELQGSIPSYNVEEVTIIKQDFFKYLGVLFG